MSTENAPSLLQLLKSGFRQYINWNDYSINHDVRYVKIGRLNILIEPGIEGVNRLLAFAFSIANYKNNAGRFGYQ